MVLFWLILGLLLFQALSGNGRSKIGLDAYESFSTKSHFAIVEDLPKGASLFFGTVDGQASVKVRSSKQLSSPFIVDGSRLLFVEATARPLPRFDLLELNVFGPAIWCDRLVSSDQYIGGPVVMTGKNASEIFSFRDVIILNPLATLSRVGIWHRTGMGRFRFFLAQHSQPLVVCRKLMRIGFWVHPIRLIYGMRMGQGSYQIPT